MADKKERGSRGRRSPEPESPGLKQEDLDRLGALGIQPVVLAGRLRLVLTIGCYRDFRFTRDILKTGSARDRVEQAIEALQDLGAHCDCEVLQALGQLPRGVLWHKSPDAPPADQPGRPSRARI